MGNESIDGVVDNFVRVVNNVRKSNKEKRRVIQKPWGNAEKWTRLLEINDSRTIWRAINWNGSIDETTPTDAEFKLHFDKLLDPETVECTNIS